MSLVVGEVDGIGLGIPVLVLDSFVPAVDVVMNGGNGKRSGDRVGSRGEPGKGVSVETAGEVGRVGGWWVLNNKCSGNLVCSLLLDSYSVV